MKVQASGILILIACILTGCDKSMKDVAGVYKSAEIITHHYSTTWVLDLAESGTFTLKEKRFRVYKAGIAPQNGRKISSEWQIFPDYVCCTWTEYGEVFSVILSPQTRGDMISGDVFSPLKRSIISSFDGISNLRFKRVE